MHIACEYTYMYTASCVYAYSIYTYRHAHKCVYIPAHIKFTHAHSMWTHVHAQKLNMHVYTFTHTQKKSLIMIFQYQSYRPQKPKCTTFPSPPQVLLYKKMVPCLSCTRCFCPKEECEQTCVRYRAKSTVSISITCTSALSCSMHPPVTARRYKRAPHALHQLQSACFPIVRC